jgi:transposase
MHPIDRRELALHIYLIHFSLRKTAEILQVSHMTISRWISSPQRKQYIRKKLQSQV